MLPPISCAYVKGWKRGVSLLICLQGVRELELQDFVAHWIKVGLNTMFDRLAHTVM